MSDAASSANSAEIIKFWRDAGPGKWFDKDARFDATFHDHFRDAHFAAARREYDAWAAKSESALALMLLLDQFPRNCFRGTGHMYATDSLARMFANRALVEGHDQQVEEALRIFFYLPFMHSEDIADQDRAYQLTEPLGGLSLESAEEHRDIIHRFGRFPHRNFILGRETTLEEQKFLSDGGFSG
jgi:uncharacterized protein (DUF924 family)